MAKLILDDMSKLKEYVGKELGTSDWYLVTQKNINLFADATEDHQWIHVDVERAKKESPFKGPIAHGYYSVSILAYLVGQVIEVKKVKLIVNYGLNKVRFPAPVPIGKKIQGKVTLNAIEDIGEGNIQATYGVIITVEGASKPSCVAEMLYRYYK
jgi:acyl dehydratase